VDLDRSRPVQCASETTALVLGYSVGVCSKKQLYALVDAEARILLIYPFSKKKYPALIFRQQRYPHRIEGAVLQ
jgi:hypothetical protein